MAPVPWESVVTINRALCQAQKMEPLTHPRGLEVARQVWIKSVERTMELQEAFGICQAAHKASPFVFNNGNTFAAVGHTLVESLLRSLPPLEAQIFRTTIGHYICGLIGRRELQQVLKHLEPLLQQETASAAPAVAGPAPAATPAAPEPTPATAVSLGLTRQQGA